MVEYDPYISPRAGMHNHFLLDYAVGYNCLENQCLVYYLKTLQLIKDMVHAWCGLQVQLNMIFQG